MGSQCRLVQHLPQQGSASAGQIPAPQPNRNSWKPKDEVGKQEVLSPTLILHTNPPAQQRFTTVYSHNNVWCCDTLCWCCRCTGFPWCCPALLRHDWKQHRRPRFSPGRLNAILVWGISYQLLLVIEPWKFVRSVDAVPRSFILSGRCAGAQPRALNSFGWQDSQDLNVAVLSILVTCSPL